QELTAPGAEVLDAQGLYVAPGFIDAHVHGGGGYDFMCGDADSVRSACRTHLMHGTTALMATVSTADNAAFLRAMDAIERASADTEQIAGIHIEGPYFAMSQRGAQSPRFIRDPDPDEYMEIARRFPAVRRWSAAPELPGALDMARRLRPLGVRMSIGHSDALYEEVLPAYEAGFDCVTHLYSCVSTVRRINAFRHAGIVEAAYLLDGMTVELIADGCHLPESLLKLALKVKGPERIMLVTDGISAAGLENVEGEIFSQTCDSMIVIEDGVAKLPDRKAFAGSVATADRLVRTMMKLGGASLVDAVKMMTSTPARYLGLYGERGSLEVGKRADVVLFDGDIDIRHVILGGRVAL
ncbi:MAG: N-acetylglucosamine-6-phosphate deacetylase, partial [Candidatus Fimadaptatus sp.]